MIVVLILGLISIPLILFIIRKKIDKRIMISSKILLLIRILFISSFILLIISIYLTKYDLSFRGKNSTSIIFNLSTFSAMFLYLFDNNVLRYFRYLIVAYTFMISGFSVFYFFAFTLTDYNDVFYNNNKFRLEQTFRGFLAMPTSPDLFVKHGLFEKRYDTQKDYINTSFIDSADIKDEIDSIKITIYHKDKNELLDNPMIIMIKK